MCAGCTSCLTRSLCSPVGTQSKGQLAPQSCSSAPLCRATRSLSLTRKEIFIRYSTPSFNTNDCFLKLSRSPVLGRKFSRRLGGFPPCPHTHFPQPFLDTKQSLGEHLVALLLCPTRGYQCRKLFLGAATGCQLPHPGTPGPTHLSGPVPEGPGKSCTPRSGGSQ